MMYVKFDMFMQYLMKVLGILWVVGCLLQYCRWEVCWLCSRSRYSESCWQNFCWNSGKKKAIDV